MAAEDWILDVDPEDFEPREGYWVTREGEEIAIRDMTDSHLRNTIRYLERTDQTDMYAYEELTAEQQRRARTP